MKIYHTETQEDYDALMTELEGKGALWNSGLKPTSSNHWIDRKEDTTVHLDDNKVITCASLGFVAEVYPNTPIQTYKAKWGYKAEEYVSMPREKTSNQAIDERKNNMYEKKKNDIPNKLIEMMEEHVELGISLLSFLKEANRETLWALAPSHQELLAKKWLQLVNDYNEYNEPPNNQSYTDIVETMTENLQ